MTNGITTSGDKMRACVSFVALALTAGCGSQVNTIPLRPPPRPVSSHGFESVVVYASGPPIRPHVAIARLELARTNDPDDQASLLMINRLRQRAGTLGCDGVVLGSTAGDSDRRSLDAVCIVYK
jgi:hypothetical protein